MLQNLVEAPVYLESGVQQVHNSVLVRCEQSFAYIVVLHQPGHNLVHR